MFRVKVYYVPPKERLFRRRVYRRAAETPEALVADTSGSPGKTGRGLGVGIEVDDALAIAEQVDV